MNSRIDLKFHNGSSVAPCMSEAITLLCDCRHDPGTFITSPGSHGDKTNSFSPIMPAQSACIWLIDTMCILKGVSVHVPCWQKSGQRLAD